MGLINQCGRPQHVLLVHGEASKLRAFRRRVATELKLPCAAPPNGTVVTIDCSRSAGVGDAASPLATGQMRNGPLLGGHRPPTSGVPAKVDLMGSARACESRDGELNFASSETMVALEPGAAKERMQAQFSAAAAFCELRWVLDVVPPPDPEQEVSQAVVGSKRRRGQLEDHPMRRETTAEQIMAELVDVFRK